MTNLFLVMFAIIKVKLNKLIDKTRTFCENLMKISEVSVGVIMDKKRF